MSPKSKTVLLILLCFALGVLVGVVGERYYLGSRPPRHPDPGQARNEFAQRMHLDTLQLSRVDSLMEYHRKRMEDIRKLFSLERDTLRAGIRKMLRPEQVPTYEDFIRQIDAQRHEGEHLPAK